MGSRSLMLLVGFLVYISIATVYTWQVVSTPQLQLTSTLFLFAPALAVLCGAQAANYYNLKSAMGRVLALLTLGITCLFIGEVIFYLYQFVWHTDPFPSVADAFYLLSYPLILVALLTQIRSHQTRKLQSNKLSLLLAGLFFVSLLFMVCYFGVYQAYDASEPLLNNAIAMAYGIGDIILILPMFKILTLAMNFRGGKLFYSWSAILVALLCITVGDILYAMFSQQYNDLVPAAGLIDLAWTAGYLLFAYSFFYTTSITMELQGKLKPSRR